MTKNGNPETGYGPALPPGAAELFLLMSGRAIKAGGCLVPTELELDTIGKAAFAIHAGEEEGSLPQVIEEITGVPSDLDQAILREMTQPAVAAHAERLGLTPEEAAQIPV